ncbi:MAG: peptide deformylase [Sulfurimonas sp.]|jgi:peptide deformylase
MATRLNIEQLGSEIIREIASEVIDIESDEIQTLIDDMFFTCEEANGMGIAAPQVNQSKAILIISSKPNERYPHAPMMEPTVLINPKIISHSDEMYKDWEGCLSLPGVRAQVPRYTDIEVSYFDRVAKQHFVKYSDFIAKVFQH